VTTSSVAVGLSNGCATIENQIALKTTLAETKRGCEIIMISIGNLLSAAKDASELFNGLKSKLLRQPDEAAIKLAAVFEEISKVFIFIEAETVNYLRLYISPDRTNIVECRGALLGLEAGLLAVKGDEARGHCHKIENIYKKYLKRWFHELLDEHEEEQLRHLFDRLGNMDDYMVEGVKSVCDWLQSDAHAVLNLIDDAQFDDANARIKAARQSLLAPRRAVSEAVRQLRALQADFIAASGAV
jgi:hypothetical protein